MINPALSPTFITTSTHTPSGAPAAGPQDAFAPGQPPSTVPTEAAMRSLFGSRVSGEHQIWQVQLSGRDVKAPPAVGPDGTLYVVTDKGLSAVSSDGKIRWETPHPGLQGYATPVIAKDAIYVTGGYKTPGLSAYDFNGKLLWQKDVGTAQVPPVFGPDDTIYFGNYDGGVHRLKPAQDPMWTKDIDRHVNGEMGVLSDGTVVLIGDPGSLHAFRPDGKVAFEKFNTDDDLGKRLSTGMGVCITPEDEILASSGSSQLYCLDARGEMKWSFTGRFEKRYDELTPEQQDECWWGNTVLGTTPVLSPDRGTIYVGGMDGKLFALDRDGRQKWNLETGDDMGDHGVQVGQDGTVYTACTRTGSIHAIDADGKVLWTYKPEKESQYAFIATRDKDVYLATHDGSMYALTGDAIQRKLEEVRSREPQGPPPTIKLDDGFVVINGVRVPVRKG